DGVWRRLLEVLQERVGSVFVHRLGGEEKVDAPIGLERPHVQVASELANVVDANLVADRLDQIEIRVRTTLDSAPIADQLAGEGQRGGALPDSGRAVEEERVRRVLGERGAQQPL